MTEHQDVQSLLPFKVKDWMVPFEDKARIEAFFDTFPFEVKARMEVLYIWFQRLLCFDLKSGVALTEEELRSVEEEKQLFFNEIGLEEYTLKYILKHCIAFFHRAVNCSTDEELQSVWEERDRFFKDNENFTTALGKYVQEKKQKSTAPAA